MQERNDSAGQTGADGCENTQIDELARNMVRLFDQSTKVFSALAERTTNGNGPYSMASEVGEAAKTLGEVARVWVWDPGKLAAAQGELFQSYADLWGRSFRRFLGEEVEPVVEPEPGDNRFKDPDWSNSQYFDFWKQAYLITSRWASDVTKNTEGVDDRTRQKAVFYLQQMLANKKKNKPHNRNTITTPQPIL
jgi:polyhydroxyalkanoate synthase